ncbi:MAG TPA: histidine kinase N-terminal domain-containing protein [Pilimelia sp.]|nr:histidine kinase N-terminal domain-containing protein [Pilimelia sp.]
MSTLRDLVEEHTALGDDDIQHLHRLAADWQLIADLSFADLLLWVPVGPDPAAPPDGAGPPAFLCVAQVRPVTAPTAYQDDQVGHIVAGPAVTHLAVACAQGRIWREGDPVWDGGTPARHEAIPVRRRTAEGEPGEIIAVVGRATNLSTARSPSQLELNYLTTADDLAQMIADGTFPPAQRHRGETTSAPRVGDGLIRLDADGRVTYASPNAQSAYRRLGFAAHLVGEDLPALAGRLADDPLEGRDVAERIQAALRGVAPARKEVEARGATVLIRALPLLPAGVPIGALVLVRDVTEVRRRDRALVTKDATIREIHHRVKNNLQTVAALLRLQARRVQIPAARAALEESVRRVASIALVHETLSLGSDEEVEFDAIVDRVASAAADGAAASESEVVLRREGTFGVLPAEIATPLVMVLNELLLNAVAHGLAGAAGEVVVAAHRFRRQLHVTVADDGRGLPADFDLAGSDRLGLQIVRTLAAGELRGTIELRGRAGGGTEAVLVVPLSRQK